MEMNLEEKIKTLKKEIMYSNKLLTLLDEIVEELQDENAELQERIDFLESEQITFDRMLDDLD